MADQLVDNSGLITGACADTDCPPGFEWGCCEIPLDIPEGRPQVETCEITVYSNSQYESSGRTCFEVIGDRFWMGGEGLNKILILEKDGTVYMTLQKPADIGTPRALGNRFGQHFVLFRDKVVVWADDYLNDSQGEAILYVYDVNGNYLEYWQLPDDYRMDINGNIPDTPISANSDFLVYGYYQTYNPANTRTQIIFWFDYYGTCFSIVEQNGYDDYFNVLLTDDYMYCGNVFSRADGDISYNGTVVIRNKDTGAFIRRLDRQTTPTFLDSFGSMLKKVEYRDGSYHIGVGQGLHELNTTVEAPRNEQLLMYTPSGDYVKTWELPDEIIDTRWDTGWKKSFFKYGFYIHGEAMIIGLPWSNMTLVEPPSNYGYGEVVITDIDLSAYEKIGMKLPVPSRKDNLGWIVWMDNDYAYMFGGYADYTTYLKRCKLTWG